MNMKMNKRTIFTILFFVFFLALIGLALFLAYKDLQISHQVAREAERIQAAIMAIDEEAADAAAQKQALKDSFTAYLNERTPVQACLTIFAILSAALGVTSLVIGIKRIAKDIEEKRKEKEKE